MESEKVVLVCLQNRTREVHLSTELSTADSSDSVDLRRLEEAVHTTFSDIPSLTDTCELIMQVCIDTVLSPVYTRIS